MQSFSPAFPREKGAKISLLFLHCKFTCVGVLEWMAAPCIFRATRFHCGLLRVWESLRYSIPHMEVWTYYFRNWIHLQPWFVVPKHLVLWPFDMVSWRSDISNHSKDYVPLFTFKLTGSWKSYFNSCLAFTLWNMMYILPFCYKAVGFFTHSPWVTRVIFQSYLQVHLWNESLSQAEL